MFWTKGWGAGIKLRLLLTHGGGGGDDKVESWRRTVGEEESWGAEVSVAAAAGGKRQTGAATGTAAGEPCFRLSCCPASTQLLPLSKGKAGCGATASLLPPAVCCPWQQPILPVAWTSLTSPYSGERTNIWDEDAILPRDSLSTSFLRSPAWRT